MPIPLIAELVPKNEGKFALLDDKNLRGSYRICATLAERNSIPADNLKYGMVVFVQENGKKYTLESDLITWTELTSASSIGGNGITNQVAYWSASNFISGITVTSGLLAHDNTGLPAAVISTTPGAILVASATRPLFSNCTILPNTTGFAITGGSTTAKTLTVSNTLTLAGTDSSTLNIGAGGTLGTAAFTAATAYEAALGNPATSGYVLSSTTDGVRSWVANGFQNPMTTLGDLLYGGTSGVATRLAGPTVNGTYILAEVVSASVAVAPTWININTITAAAVTNSLTINNSGTGAASGTTFNGSSAVTISYNTIGALPNLYTTLGDLDYAGASGIPARLAGPTVAGTYILTETPTGSAAVAPVWTNANTLTVAKTTNLVGAAWGIPYQSATDTTSFVAQPGAAGRVFLSGANNAAPNWSAGTLTLPASGSLTIPAFAVSFSNAFATTGAFSTSLTQSANLTLALPPVATANMVYNTAAPGANNQLVYAANTSNAISYITAPAALSVLTQSSDAAAPAWTTATGTGSPVMGTDPTITLNSSNKLILNFTPALGTDAVNKTYVDNIALGLNDWKQGTGFVKVSGGTISYDNSAYLTGTKVDSFNTRTGAVTLTSSDVTAALTYTPINKAGDTGIGNLSMSALSATTGTFSNTITQQNASNWSASPVLTSHSQLISGSSGLTKLTNIASYTVNNNTGTGTIKITLPVSWTNTMIRMRIAGYAYDASGAYEIHLGGYNYSTTLAWTNTSAVILGDCPFTSIRFGHDGTYCCILLGTTSTVLSYPKITIEEVELGHSGISASWVSGWTITQITSETGITITGTPTIKTAFISDGAHALSATSGTFSGALSASQFNGSGAGLTGTANSLSIGGNAATANNLNNIRITASTDLNSYTTPGFYYCPLDADAATLTNCPSANAFGMIVAYASGVTQFLWSYMTSSGNYWMRKNYSGTWGSWVRILREDAQTYGISISGTASNVSAANNTINANYYPVFATSQGTSVALGTNSGFTFNPSTNLLTIGGGISATTGTFSGALSANAGMNINRVNSVSTGILYYSSGYTAWQTYMSNAGVASGVSGTVVAPTGTYVTTWGLRNFIENAAGYGWTWESGTGASTTPSIVAELSSNTGNFRTIGSISATTGTFSSQVSVTTSDSQQIKVIQGTQTNYIGSTGSSGNAQLTIQGANYTHGLNLLDSYNTTAYAALYGGYYNNDATLTLRKYSAQNTVSATSVYASTYANISGPLTATSGTFSSNITTGGRLISTGQISPNLHLDPTDGANSVYLNYYAGTGGVNFCNGANGIVASISGSGALTATSGTFSGKVIANGPNLGLANGLEVYYSALGPLAAFRSLNGSNNPYFMISGTSTGITLATDGSSYGDIRLRTSSTDQLIISTTGAATFSSSVSMGALTATSGSFSGTLSLPSNGSTYFKIGNGDAASMATCNIDLAVWNGFGLWNPTTGGTFPNQRSIYFDVRNGAAEFGGGITATTGTFSGALSATSGTFSSNITTGGRLISTGQISPNLHLDPTDGANSVYLNYYAGTGGVNFCNGANGIVASIDGSGNGTFNGVLLATQIYGKSNLANQQAPLNYSYIGSTDDNVTDTVVLLHPAYNGTLINKYLFDGTITFQRGSTGSYNISDNYDVKTSTAYSSNTGSIISKNTQRVANLVTCTYNSVLYVALYVPKTASRDVYYKGDLLSTLANPLVLSASSVSNVSVLAQDNTNLGGPLSATSGSFTLPVVCHSMTTGANFTGNWLGANYWGIGPISSHGIRLGMVDSSNAFMTPPGDMSLQIDASVSMGALTATSGTFSSSSTVGVVINNTNGGNYNCEMQFSLAGTTYYDIGTNIAIPGGAAFEFYDRSYSRLMLSLGRNNSGASFNGGSVSMGALSATGGNFTQDLNLITAPDNAVFAIKNGSNRRWAIFSHGSETGSNAGSDIAIANYTDAGAYGSIVFSINRATGAANFASSVSMGALTATTGSFSGALSATSGSFTLPVVCHSMSAGANFTGNWPGANYWGIGPISSHGIRLGMVDSSNAFMSPPGDMSLQIDASVSMGAFGSNGKTPQTSASVNAACTDLNTAIALVNQLRSALIANGICV